MNRLTSRRFLIKLASRRAAMLLPLGAAALFAGGQGAQAANTTYTTTSASGNWTTAAWSTAITGIVAGDIAQFNTAATAATLTLDTNATLGQLQLGTAATSTWAIAASGSFAFTLDGTGISSGNQMFGNAGEAAIGTRGVGANMTVSPNISFGTTALALGSTTTGTLTIGGNVTASATQTLFFRGSGNGVTTVNGAISATAGTVAISNQRGSGGSVTIATALGSTVGNITQGTLGGSGTSQLTLSAANTSTGTVTINAGQVNLNNTNTFAIYNVNGGVLSLGNAGAIGAGSVVNLHGGSTLQATTSVNLTGAPTFNLDGIVTFTNNNLNLGTGAVTLAGSNVGVIITSAATYTVGGNISGSASLTKVASGPTGTNIQFPLVLGGTNSYTGGTIVRQGFVQFNTAASVPATGTITLGELGTNSVGFQAAGISLGFALDQATLNKISAASVGVVAFASSGTSNALSFANLPNVSLGNTGSALSYTSATLTPYSSSNNAAYQFGGGNGGAATSFTVTTPLGNVGAIRTNLVLDPTFAGILPGNVTLSGANTFTGSATVNTGTLTLSGSLNAATGVALANGGTFAYAPTVASTTQTVSGLSVGTGFNSVTTAAAANTLNLGAVTRGGTIGYVNFTPTGTITTTTANTNGILGTFASTGSGATLQYATGGGTITAYGGATAATAADLSNVTSATTNYSAAAATTTTGNQTGNTLRYTGAAATIALGTNSLTLNGLMQAGTGLLTVSGTAGSAGLVTGANGVLDIVSNSQGVAISSVISGAGAVTYGGPGAGTLTLSGANTYAGGTILNNGTLTVSSATALGTGAVTLSGGTVQNSVALTVANNLVFSQGTTTLVNANAFNLTLAGAITGSGTLQTDGGSFASLIQTGDVSGFTGTLIYNGNNGSGDNMALSGTTGSARNFSQATIVGENTGSRRLDLGATGNLVQFGSLAGSLQLTNTGAVQVGALNTSTAFGGTTNVNIGSFTKVGTGTLTLNGAGALGFNGGTFVNNGTLALDLGGVVSGINQINSVALTLNGGTLSVLGKAQALNSSQAFSSLTVNAGSSAIAVDANGGSGTVVTLAGITRTTTVGTVGGGTVNFTLPGGTQSATNGVTTTSTVNVLGGILTQANTNSVAYATVGQTDWAALSGNNIVALTSYGAGFTGNGDITASVGASGATANSVRFNTDNVTLTLTGANAVTTGGILTTANSTATGSTITGGTLTTGGGREFVFIDYGRLTVASQLVNNVGGATALTKSGTGTLLLANTNNTYSGINYLNEGIVNIAAAGSLGTNVTAAALSFNGGTLQLGAAGIDVSAMGINLGFKGGTIDTNGNASTYSGVVASSAAVQGTILENTAGQFGLTKAGVGTLTLGSAVNTYAGATTVTGGTLSVSNLASQGTAGGTASGIGQSANYAKNLVLNGGVLQYSGAAASSDRLFTLGDAGGGLNASGAGAITFTNTGAVGYAVVSNGAATHGSPTLTLNGNNAGANTLAASLANNGLGTTSLTKSGAGTWVLTAANSYSGATTVSAGTLVIAGNQTGTGQLIVNNAGSLQFGDGTSTNGSSVNSGTIFVNNTGTVAINKSDGGTVTNQVASNPSATTTLSGLNATGTTNTFTATAFNNGGGFAINSSVTGATLAFSGAAPGAIDLKGTDLTVGGAGDTLFTSAGSGLYSSTTTSNVTKNGTGTLIYQGNQGYTGTTAINGGAVRVDIAQTNGGTYLVGNGGTTTTAASLLLGGGSAGLTGGVSFNRGVTITPGDGTSRTVGGTNTSGTNTFASNIAMDGAPGENKSINLTAASGGTVAFNGGISGAGQNVTKLGLGTVTIGASTSFSGSTTISAGTLIPTVAGALGSTGSVTVNSTGTLLLAGTGDRINNAASVTLNAGTFNTGGLSETVGALTLASSSVLDLASGASILNFANSSVSSFTGTLSIYNWSGIPATGGGTDQVYFGNSTAGLTAGQLAQIEFFSGAGTGDLGSATILANGEIVPVPEPGTVAAGLLALGSLGVSQRRRVRGWLCARRRMPLSA